jgi:hypothetical protein
MLLPSACPPSFFQKTKRLCLFFQKTKRLVLFPKNKTSCPFSKKQNVLSLLFRLLLAPSLTIAIFDPTRNTTRHDKTTHKTRQDKKQDKTREAKKQGDVGQDKTRDIVVSVVFSCSTLLPYPHPYPYPYPHPYLYPHPYPYPVVVVTGMGLLCNNPPPDWSAPSVLGPVCSTLSSPHFLLNSFSSWSVYPPHGPFHPFDW